MMSELLLIKLVFPKVLVASLCGALIGLERELKHKVAGIRTHILVCVGACLFTLTSTILAEHYKVDPTRIIGQIITGIGFLGAGVILKQDDKVVGVTSSAFIWFASSIGVIIGCGYMMAPILLTVGLLIMLIFLQKIEKLINQKF